MNIKIASSWSELNEWQLGKISKILLNTKEETFNVDFLKMALILFQGKNTFWSRLKVWRITRLLPADVLKSFSKFLLDEEPQIHEFPEIEGLIKPANRLGDITIKQFSIIDTLYYQWDKKKDELSLQLFIASLYRLHPIFDRQDMPKVADISDLISDDKRHHIALAYKSSRLYISNRYPIIFPKPRPQEEVDTPSFRKKGHYTPFSKVINSVAMEEPQPLGNFHECNVTLIYDFMDVFTELLIKQCNQNK